MFTECNNILELGTNKQFWIDAGENDTLSCKLYFINKEFEIVNSYYTKLTYLQNNLWKGEIISPDTPSIVLGEVTYEDRKSFFNVNYQLQGNFLYSSNEYKEGLKLEWLQLNEKAEIIDYGNMIEIGNGFYGGALNEKIPSLICVENICAIFKIQSLNNCSDAKTEKELKQCLEQNNTIMQKYILLEKKLNECLNSNKIEDKPILKNIYKSSEDVIVNQSKDKTKTSPTPKTFTTKNINSSTNNSTNITSNITSSVKTSKISSTKINSKLK